MKTESVTDRITEKEVLDSLEAAISSYAVKDFETITKRTLKNSKGVKRVKKTLKKELEPESAIIKSKIKKLKRKAKAKKKPLYRRGILKGIRNKTRSVTGAIKSFSSRYQRQLITGGLAIFLLTFVSYSTYIAYAFMSGANADVVTKVGSHVILPTGETPKIYVIQSDKSEIFQNPLFSGIAVGDNVLTYQNAGKVIIYRGKEDKIVNIVNTGQ